MRPIGVCLKSNQKLIPLINSDIGVCMSEKVFFDNMSEQEAISQNVLTLFCTHTNENIPAIVDSVQDADIVAIELIGGTSEQRRHATELANAITMTDTTTPLYEEVTSTFESIYGSPEDEFAVGLVEALGGSKKYIHFVDMPSDTPAYEAFGTLEDKNTELVESLQADDISGIAEKLQAKVDADAAIIRDRELLVSEQLESILVSNPHQKAALVAGAVHTPISYRIEKKHKTERIFIDGGDSSKPYEYSPLEALIRAKTIHPERETGKSVFKRAMLDIIILQYDAENADLIARTTADEILDEAIEGALGEYHVYRKMKRWQAIKGQRVGR